MLDSVTPNELIIAGWVLVRAVPTPKVLGQTLPAQLITISDCIQDDLPRPEPWLGDWFQDGHEAGLAAAQAAGEPPTVVTVAMHPDDAAAFIAQWEGDDSSWFALLRQRSPLSPATQILGYEVVGAEEGLDFHSWHCHGYADEVQAAVGVVTNDNGLIQNLAEARSVLTWMLERPDSEAPEPVPWTVVALAVDT